MKLLSATSSGLVSHPKNKMVECIEINKKCKEILRDIFYSEELKIDLERCKALLKLTIEMLCVDENKVFNDAFLAISQDIE